MFLGFDLAAELVLRQFLLRQLLVAPGLEGAEPPFEPAGPAAVEPDGRARKILQEAAVMADQRQRRTLRGKVRTVKLKEKAEKITKKVKGVTSVVNELEVTG